MFIPDQCSVAAVFPPLVHVHPASNETPPRRTRPPQPPRGALPPVHATCIFCRRFSPGPDPTVPPAALTIFPRWQTLEESATADAHAPSHIHA